MARGNVTGPNAGPAGLLKPRPVTLIPAPVKPPPKPAPKGNITKKGSGSAGAARPKPVVVRAPAPAPRPTPTIASSPAHTGARSTRPVPPPLSQQQARSPAHTGARAPKPKPAPMLMASRNPKAQALAILATQTNATPQTVARVRKLAAVANLTHPNAPLKTGAAPVAPVKVSDPRVQKLIAGGYLQVAGRQDNPADFGTANVLFGPGAKKLVKGPKFQTAKSQPVPLQAGFTPMAAKLLSDVGRPYHATAGAIDALVRGKNAEGALEAFNKGASGKGKVGGGEILQHAGVKSKFLQGVLGFGIDIVIDPTTGITFGAGTLAQKAAVQAAEAAGKKALAEGATAEAARSAAQDAARQVAKKAGVGEKGLTFHMYGREVPGVRRGTAAANKATKRVLAKPRAEIKEVAREVNPHLAPPGVPIAEHQAVSAAGGAARGQIHRAEELAANIGRGLQSLPVHSSFADAETQYRAMIRAIETKRYDSLPTKQLQDAARTADERMLEQRNLLAAEGVPIGDITKAQIKIPDVTANPRATAKTLREAQTRRNTAERANSSQIRKSGVAEGRAQVLVRQADRKAGAATDRARALDRIDHEQPVPPEVVADLERRGLAIAPEHHTQLTDHPVLTPEGRAALRTASNKPVRTLTKLERQQSKLTPAEQEVQNARQAVKDAQSAHEAEVALHREQKAARKVATPKFMQGAVKQLDHALAERTRALEREQGPKILKGRSKTDLTKAQQDFPSANQIARVRSGQPGAPFELANKPREALTPVDIADRKVAAAQAKVDELRGSIAKGFVPHNLTDILEPAKGGFRPEGAGSQTIKIGTMNKRQDLRTLEAKNAESPGKFSTNLPLLVANYLASVGTAAAKARFNKALMATGRRVEYSKEPMHLGEGEQLWVIHGANIHPVQRGESKIAGGQYVVLNQKLAEHHIGNVVPMAGRTKGAEYFDHATGLWKRSKTFSLAFHARNMIGDTHMAYLVPGRSFRRVAIEAGQAGKVLAAARRMDKAERNLEAFGYSGKTIKVGKQRIPVEDVVQRLRHAGATDTGYLSRELRDLRGQSGAERRFTKLPGRGRLKQVMEERENLHRIGTALHGIGKKGMTDNEAAALSRYHHIDYGNLSKTEKVALRRVMPFYTFTARGLPIFVKALAKSPGKFAAYEKLIEETARATGSDRDKAYRKLQVWEAQQVPLIVGGKQAATSSPVNLFNLLPDPTSVGRSGRLAFDQLMGLGTPLIKTPVEVMNNYSFFTHRKIRDPKTDPYAAAPDWVKELPKSLQKKLGVIDNYIDPRTGKKILGWNPYSAYGVGQAPALVGQASQLLTKGTGLRGQNLTQKAIADITGVKISPVDKATNQVINNLYNRWNAADNRIKELNHQFYRGHNVSAANPTAEYTRLLKQRTDLGKQINAAATKLGDKTPPFASRTKPDPLAALAAKAGLSAKGGPSAAQLDALAKKAGLPAKGGISKAELDALAKKAGLP